MSVCYGSYGIPEPCSGWTVYNSYVTDPKYQRYLTIAWTSTIGLVLLFTLPTIVIKAVRARPLLFFRQGRWRSFFGIYETLSPSHYQLLSSTTSISPPTTFKLPRSLLFITSAVRSATLYTPAFSVSRNRFHFPSVSTLLQLLLIPLFLLLVVFPQSQLRDNPNRFGFISLACLPPLFVLSSKNGPIQILLKRSYVAVNFLHRWLGRAVVLMVLLHMYFWTIQYRASHQIGVFLSGDKEVRGLTALAFLLLIALSSLPAFRKISYTIFFVLHYVGIIGFLVFVNKHTIYARGWATWSIVGIYVVDIVGRLMGMRLRWIEVEAMEGGMTRVGMKGLHGGWRGGQFLSLRIFYAPVSRSVFSCFRAFESHPFSIASSPPGSGVLRSSSFTSDPSSSAVSKSSEDAGIQLYIRSCGSSTWTGDLYQTASHYSRAAKGKRKMLALVEGPFNGATGWSELEDKESVLLVCGGSGMSVVLGTLDELVGAASKRNSVSSWTREQAVEVVWAVRDRAHIAWFHQPLQDLLSIASSLPNVSLSLKIHLTGDADLSSATSSPTTSTSSLSKPLSIPIGSQIFYTRPNFSSILRTSVDGAIIPCAKCTPVCRCGEISSSTSGEDGMCPNDEEACCGISPVKDYGGVLRYEDEIEEVNSKGKSCCAGKGEEEKDRESVKGSSCCKKNEVVGVAEALKVRTGGLGVLVCGPKGMIAELKNAIAAVPLAKQVRIGGIEVFSEQFYV